MKNILNNFSDNALKIKSTSEVMTSILTKLVIGLSADQEMDTDWFFQNKAGLTTTEWRRPLNWADIHGEGMVTSPKSICIQGGYIINRIIQPQWLVNQVYCLDKKKKKKASLPSGSVHRKQKIIQTKLPTNIAQDVCCQHPSNVYDFKVAQNSFQHLDFDRSL